MVANLICREWEAAAERVWTSFQGHENVWIWLFAYLWFQDALKELET